MTTKVVDVEDADLTALSAVDTLNVGDTAADLGLALGLGAFEVLKSAELWHGQGRASLVDMDSVLSQACDKCRAEKRSSDRTPLVTAFVRAWDISFCPDLTGRGHRPAHSHNSTIAR